MRLHTVSVLATATVLAALGGCATQGPQPTQEMTRARTLIEQSEKAQAQQYDPTDLQRARDELNSADMANSKGETDAARAFAESAAADADVAAARAAAGQAQHAANDARQANLALQRESDRAVDNSAGATSGATSSYVPATTAPAVSGPPATPVPPAPPPAPPPPMYPR